MRMVILDKVRKIEIPNKLSIASVTFLLVLGGLFASIVSASIPDSGGVIHACYSNRDGSLRAIDTNNNGTCSTSKETALNWNQFGASGGSIVLGNKSVSANTSDSFLFSAPNLLNATITPQQMNDLSFEYCPNGANYGGTAFASIKNTSSVNETIWMNGQLGTTLAPNAEINMQTPFGTVFASDGTKMVELHLSGGQSFDSFGNPASCNYAWSYSVN